MTDQPTPAEATCGFPGNPGPAGHVHSCQLCPGSPTYWRGKDAESSGHVERACRWTPPANAEATP